MKIIDEVLLDSFRFSTQCEYCKRTVLTGLDPHHMLSRGFGGGTRLDVRINLIALCRECHRRFHDGHILYADLLAIVSARENMLQDDIEREIFRLRRARK